LGDPSSSDSILAYPILRLKFRQDWTEYALELINHWAHAQGTIAIIKDALPAHILTYIV
jgi:hypothetical protein